MKNQHDTQVNVRETRLKHALTALKNGQGVLVTDDENRENEADLIFPAETLTEQQMAMLIRECSGIVCLCLTEEKVKTLGLSLMVNNNTSRYQTAFTISIEAAHGVTTGVSASDRLKTIQAAISEDATPQNLRQPGHVFPLQAKSGGVLERPGHTEATIDLMRLAHLKPCGVLCELMNPDGTMSKGQQIIHFSQQHQIPIVTVADIIHHRKNRHSYS